MTACLYPAGERPGLDAALAPATPGGDFNGQGWGLDRPDLSRPERPCACCGNRFQPTQRRRMLCRDCFREGER